MNDLSKFRELFDNLDYIVNTLPFAILGNTEVYPILNVYSEKINLSEKADELINNVWNNSNDPNEVLFYTNYIKKELNEVNSKFEIVTKLYYTDLSQREYPDALSNVWIDFSDCMEIINSFCENTNITAEKPKLPSNKQAPEVRLKHTYNRDQIDKIFDCIVENNWVNRDSKNDFLFICKQIEDEHIFNKIQWLGSQAILGYFIKTIFNANEEYLKSIDNCFVNSENNEFNTKSIKSQLSKDNNDYGNIKNSDVIDNLLSSLQT